MVTEDFSDILERLEDKYDILPPIRLLHRMSEFRSKQDSLKRKTAEMDIFRNEEKDETYVIDSSQVMGASTILMWLKRRRETKREMRK